MAKTMKRERTARPRPLTPREARFCEEYLVDLNATQAAIRAGYSARSARAHVGRLLTNETIACRIAELRDARSTRVGVQADDVLRGLWRIAMLDIGEAFDASGALKPLADMPEGVRRAIASIEIDELFNGRGGDRASVGVTRKVRFHDKIRALDLLGQHLGLWKAKVEVTGKDGGPIERRSVEQLSDEELLAIVLEAREAASAPPVPLLAHEG